MDSAYKLEKYMQRKIRSEELKNDRFAESKSSLHRSNLILSFFSYLEPLRVSRRHKERAVLMYDKISLQLGNQLGSICHQRLFLLSFLNVSIKLEEGSLEAKKIIEKIIGTLRSESQGTEESDEIYVKMSDIYAAEVFLLNGLGWKVELTIFSEFTDFFISSYFDEIFINVESEKDPQKDIFYLFIDYFSECSLSTFITFNVPMHTVALIIILISLDQYKPYLFSNNYSNSKSHQIYEEIIKNILIFFQDFYEVDFLRVENYKKIILDYLEERGIKIIKNYPDNMLQSIIEERKLNDSNYFKTSKNFKNTKFKNCSGNVNFTLEFDKLNIDYHSGSSSQLLSKTSTDNASNKTSPGKKKFILENDELLVSNYRAENKKASKYPKGKEFKEDSTTLLPILEENRRKSKSMNDLPVVETLI